jgi:hypothetical protein
MLERLSWRSGQVACPGFVPQDIGWSQEGEMTTEVDVLADARRFRQAIVEWAEGYRAQRRAAIQAGPWGAAARGALLLWSNRYFQVEGGSAPPGVH